MKDEAVRLRTVDEVKAALSQSGFVVEGGEAAREHARAGVVTSPITGPSGNVEYLVRAVFSPE